MTVPRFTLENFTVDCYVENLYVVVDNEKEMTEYQRHQRLTENEVVDLLNEQHEKIRNLEKEVQNDKCKYIHEREMHKTYKHYNNDLNKENKELREENEQLKQYLKIIEEHRKQENEYTARLEEKNEQLRKDNIEAFALLGTVRAFIRMGHTNEAIQKINKFEKEQLQ